MAEARQVETVVEEKKEDGVDRQKICPFLLRVFLSTNGYNHKPNEYAKGNVPENELQIYTWRDATLTELGTLVKKVNPDARRKGTKFTFALVYPDSRSPVYRMREIGSIIAGQRGPEDMKNLNQSRFTIGDYMDISIAPPEHWNAPRKGFQGNFNNHRQRPY